MQEKKTASQICKEEGLKSLAEVHRITKIPVSTLNDWHKNKPEAFLVVVLGAAVIKNKREPTSS